MTRLSDRKLIPFEQGVLRFLQQQSLIGRPLLVAVSGGADSMGLLTALARTSRAAKNQIAAVYVHHGKGSPRQTSYRNKAQALVQKFCEQNEIPFFTNEKWPTKTLKSENELRNFRHEVFRNIRSQMGGDAILCCAHHADDLVETQLLRMIRGTGLQGLQGFAAFADGVARPFVGPETLYRKKDILKYVRAMKVEFIEDPSNTSSEPLRNWLRQKWISPLERREKGLYASLSRSLQQLADSWSRQNLPENVIQEGRIDHRVFLTLTADAKAALLALYMRQQNIHDYGSSHVREVLRRLDSEAKEHNFRLLRRHWYVNAEHIFCEPEAKRDTLKNES